MESLHVLQPVLTFGAPRLLFPEGILELFAEVGSQSGISTSRVQGIAMRM